MTGPMLNPPCSGWEEDLPLPDATPNISPTLGFDAPNYQDHIYLEISRSPAFARGLLLFMSIMSGVIIFLIVETLMRSYSALKLKDIILTCTTLPIIVWGAVLAIRADISPPRDLPLRFNRLRQRIYAYNYNYRWWNPFERWSVAPVSYDWSQVRAERWKKRGATVQGGMVIKWGVVISIIKPGTNEVIDRFPLSTMGADEFAWSYICTYMQQGPSALPPPGTAYDHNDVIWCDIARRLAPRVKWPKAMDLESRTAP